MHKAFRAALTDAVGRSEFIIVIVADIRGFSSFSRQHESPDTAMYVKRVYMKLIDEYFKNASFFKPTGDGLLVTIPFTEKTLPEIANKIIEACICCVREFGSICAGDNMINFPTPTQIGFGVARGTACCLHSGDVVLDYSGHLLNLASRLMNLARPAGIVLDGGFGISILKKETQELFSETEVYVKGLAEEAPLKVYIQKGAVEIPGEAKAPLRYEAWQKFQQTCTLSEWKKYLPNFRVDLPSFLKRADAVQVRIIHPVVRSGKILPGVAMHKDYQNWKYVTAGGQACITVDIDTMVKQMKSLHLPKTARVMLLVNFLPAVQPPPVRSQEETNPGPKSAQKAPQG